MRPAPSAIHQFGSFASRDIPKGTLIGHYFGEVISKEESARRLREGNDYIFDLDEYSDIDGNVPGNFTRFINHSCSPNCESSCDGGKVRIHAIRSIGKGEELTMNYGFTLENYQRYPCHCGSPACVGYMVAEEFFEEVRGRSAS